jgi:N-methylhydantoinase A
MADAIREITVEQGEDPRRAALIAFGGAGPVFACLLADELGIARIVIPPHAGNFSAFGLLSSDLTQTLARTRILRLVDDHLDAVEAILDELWSELESRRSEAARREARLDLRHVGQEYSLAISLPIANGGVELDAAAIRQLFESEYERTFGHTIDEAIEVVVVRASLVVPLPPLRSFSAQDGAAGTAAEELDTYSLALRSRVPFRVLDRTALSREGELRGPAIVHEPTATTYLDAGFVARVHETGVLVVDHEENAE